MKELLRISTMIEGPDVSLNKLSKIKIPKVLTTELVILTQKASKLLQVIMDDEINATTPSSDKECDVHE